MGAFAPNRLRQGAGEGGHGMNTIDRARHRWLEILPRLGIDRQYLQNKHGPCPLLRRQGPLSVRR